MEQLIEGYVPQSVKLESKISKTDFLSGLITYGKLIGGSHVGGASNTFTLYTCPQGKNFFLVSGVLSVMNKTTASAYGYFRVLDLDIYRILTFDVPSGTNYFSESASISFSIPLKIIGGQTIQIKSDGSGATVTGAFCGYEIDASLIPNFI